MMNFKRYSRNPLPEVTGRRWPEKTVDKAPIWCSVDLRDGNQALMEPMVVEEKVEFVQMLVKLGFKDIEVGFPSSSQIEFDFVRQLVDRKLIPEGVRIQVAVQCRPEFIDRPLESIEG
ncbi:MAG: 2-isopropylmalate synthase, partial [Lachnospiraceae bacterium]|nr:2-isopropylmalate synthase [Lachnospiraceae bacterium]